MHLKLGEPTEAITLYERCQQLPLTTYQSEMLHKKLAVAQQAQRDQAASRLPPMPVPTQSLANAKATAVATAAAAEAEASALVKSAFATAIAAADNDALAVETAASVVEAAIASRVIDPEAEEPPWLTEATAKSFDDFGSHPSFLIKSKYGAQGAQGGSPRSSVVTAAAMAAEAAEAAPEPPASHARTTPPAPPPRTPSGMPSSVNYAAMALEDKIDAMRRQRPLHSSFALRKALLEADGDFHKALAAVSVADAAGVKAAATDGDASQSDTVVASATQAALLANGNRALRALIRDRRNRDPHDLYLQEQIRHAAIISVQAAVRRMLCHRAARLAREKFGGRSRSSISTSGRFR